jgi:hypothetical protein
MIALKASTLRPGLLVSLHTSIEGNVNYERTDIERERTMDDGKRRAVWETKKTVDDPAELEAAIVVRGKASSLIRSICAKSAFGLLCPEDAAENLDNAISEARRLCEAFNQEARLTRVKVYVMCGRIAADDVEAVRAINSEVRELLQTMQDGVRNFDVKEIRDAASKAKQLGSMLQPEAAARVQVAIEAVRKTARQLTSAGETAAREVDTYTLRKIKEARTAFLDLDDQKDVQTPQTRGRAVDLEPETETKRAPKAKRAELEV